MKKFMVQFSFVSFLLLPFMRWGDGYTATNTVVCKVNARASRSHSQRHAWVGPLPPWGQTPDPSVPFDLGGGTDKAFLFTGLETSTPTIRIEHGVENTATRVWGVETVATTFHRAEGAVFFRWEYGPNEFYTAVYHFKSKTAAINSISTCRGNLCDVGVSAVTVDCQ